MAKHQTAQEAAQGRWAEILQRSGVDPSFLTGRAGPCPFCGGRDRYQFRIKTDNGSYICRNCTNAQYRNGFDFLMRHLGITEFREAAEHVKSLLGVSTTSTPGGYVSRPAMATQTRETDDARAARETAKMDALWSAARTVTSGDPVDLYLRSRIPGLQRVPAEIRYHPALQYWDPPEGPGDRFTLRGEFPGMLVRGFDASDRHVQVHKTFLTLAGAKADVPFQKKTGVGVGSNSYAFRIGGMPQGDTLGVCEGIESGLASMVLRPGVPVWSCHSASVLANFKVPDSLRGQIKWLVIFSDNDAAKRYQCSDGTTRVTRAGQDAAKLLTDRMRKEGIRTMIVQAARVGDDMVDLVKAAA